MASAVAALACYALATPMIDFAGWADNWEWPVTIASDPPPGLVRAGLAAGAAGACAVGWAWVASGATEAAWPFGALALGVAFNLPSLLAPRALAVVLGHSLALAGILALATPAGAAGRAWLPLALALPFAASPLLTHLWAATLFSMEMVVSSRRLQADAQAALTESSETAVVQITGTGEGGYAAALHGPSGERPVTVLHAALGRDRVAREGMFFLLERPVIEPRPRAGSDYRTTAYDSVITAAAKARPLGIGSPRGIDPEVFSAEVRAGAVALAGYHVALAAVALWLAHHLGT